MRTRQTFFAAMGVLLAFKAAAAPRAGVDAGSVWRLSRTVSFSGKSPSWDYVTVDVKHGRLFLGRRAAGVTVFDTRAGRVLTTIENSAGANGVALVPEFDRGYAINGDGTTTIFALSSLKTLGREKLGSSADAGYYDAASRHVVVTRGDDHMLTFVDAKTGRDDGDMKMNADELEGVASDGRGGVFVLERDKVLIAKIDPIHHLVVAEWPIAGCSLPTGLAIDRERARLFVGCKGERPILAVVDASDGRLVFTAPIGRGNDGVVYDAQSRKVFTSNGVDANIVIFDQLGADAYKLDQAITTRPIARTMAYDPATRTIYTAAAEGLVDPAKPINRRAGEFYPNTFFDDSYKLFIYTPRAKIAAPAADD